MENRTEIAATKVYPLIIWLKSKGVREQDLFMASGITPDIFLKPDSWISSEKIISMFEAAGRMSGDPLAGIHIGQSIGKGFSHILSYVMQNSPDLKYALNRFLELEKIVDHTGITKIEIQGENAIMSVSFLSSELLGCRNLIDYRLSGCRRYAELLTGSKVPLVRVNLTHQSGELKEKYEAEFGCPVYFGKKISSIIIEKSILDRKLIEPNPDMLLFFEKRASAIAGCAGTSGSASSRLAGVFFLALSQGFPQLEEAASQLGMSARSLQKRLKDEGSSFNDIAENVKKEAACQYLRENELSLGEISFLMGFSEPSAFHRSFKKWTGTTPAEFRFREKIAASDKNNCFN